MKFKLHYNPIYKYLELYEYHTGGLLNDTEDWWSAWSAPVFYSRKEAVAWLEENRPGYELVENGSKGETGL